MRPTDTDDLGACFSGRRWTRPDESAAWQVILPNCQIPQGALVSVDRAI
ncbi:hypothetical protein SF83666_c23040 [Sinorhizobium fredii CCBAU 83666]|nr:hypothetical protein SF83666_c23040 [Sinorhizobium fredii CCBAU 83666]